MAGKGKPQSDMHHAFVLRANGVVVAANNVNGLFTGAKFDRLRLYPGDEIIVPYKLPTGAFVRGLRDLEPDCIATGNHGRRPSCGCSMIYADQRWTGCHGIGRFAKHVLEGLDFSPVPLASSPAAKLDAVRLAWALKDLGPQDLFFSPGYNTPLFCGAPSVFTIHDLSHIRCPENRKPAISLYYATVMKRASSRAHLILTVSEFTRKQIVDWCGVPAERAVNVSCGVTLHINQAANVSVPSFHIC